MHSDPSQPHPQRRHASDEELLAGAIPISNSGDPESVGPPSGAAQSGQEREPRPEAIEFDEDDAHESPQDSGTSSRIQAMGPQGGRHQERQWKRKPQPTGQGAVRVKTFVAKLRYEAIEHLDEQINEWLEQHPDCEVKFVTTAIGPLTSKLKEDALFVNVWV